MYVCSLPKVRLYGLLNAYLIALHSCRESAEQRVKELQYLLNQTFKRFSINYDDDGDDHLSDEVSEL